MTQEEKNLLLKDLCARLPYGVITKNCKNNFDVPVHLLPDVNGIKQLIAEYDLKPYLRPLSSMTEDEEIEYECTCDRNYLEFDNSYFYTDTPQSIDYLNEHFFDYRGLIEKGLALEAPERMYNQ